MVTDSNGEPWTGAFVNANGDLTVDLRSNIGAESRAKIVYERLLLVERPGQNGTAWESIYLRTGNVG